MTAHAGEAAGAQSVRDAVEIIGVSRVGHGVHSYQDASLVSTLREQQITLEMCPTSNLQTRSVSNLAQHPLYRYYRDGLRVTVNTDNRTVSGTDMTRELLLCHEEMLLSLSDLADTTLTALRAGFANADERQSLEHDFKAEMAALGMLEE